MTFFSRNVTLPLVFMGVIGLTSCVACSQSGVEPLLDPLPQDATIQVYFNQSQASVYTDPYRQQERLGDDLEQVLVEAIASAQRSVDVAVQELRLPAIALALQERHQAGVQVRVILENNYNIVWSQLSANEISDLDSRDRNKYLEFLALADTDGNGQVSPSEAATTDIILMLQTAGIPFIDDTADGSQGSDLMHHKYIVVDNQIVVVGSANFSTSGIHGDLRTPESLGNANHLLRIDNPAIAQLFTDEFNLMWGDGPGGQLDSLFGLQKPYRAPQTVTLAPDSTITLQFSPTSSSLDWPQTANGLIGRSLESATSTVDLALFVFSDQDLSNVLLNESQQGVNIRALIDPSFSYRYYSEGLDMMGVALPDNRCRYGEGNNPWPIPLTTVGIPQLPEGDVLHHKFAVIDNRIVVTGSQNWSNAANRSNDENVLIITNPIVTAHFQREFDRLYETASLGLPGWLQQKVQEDADRCR